MSRSIAIFGATSTIARHVALALVGPTDRVCLAARSLTELQRIASDLQLRKGAAVVAQRPFDTGQPATHRPLVEDIHRALGGLDIAIVCTGELGDQEAARHDPEIIHRILHSNFNGVATVLAPVADIMESNGRGTIAVLSSVAGDRGRQSNYIYGSAKAGIGTYLEGLRNRLFRRGVAVITIKLGFTDTKMVYGKPGMFLVLPPDAAAVEIVRHLGRGSHVAYIPWFWRPIMMVIKKIPASVFNRLRL